MTTMVRLPFSSFTLGGYLCVLFGSMLGYINEKDIAAQDTGSTSAEDLNHIRSTSSCNRLRSSSVALDQESTARKSLMADRILG